MEHKELADTQHRPMWMIKKGLFYCLCPKCNEQHTEQAQNIHDRNDWFYYSEEPCPTCQKSD